MPAPTAEKHPILGATHTRIGHMAKKPNHLWYNGSGRSEVFCCCCCFNCNDSSSIHSAKPGLDQVFIGQPFSGTADGKVFKSLLKP